VKVRGHCQLADHLGERGRRLRTLELEGNRLGSAPFIQRVTNLTALNLASNHLTSLDTSIGKLVSLQSLVVENNHLTALPDSLCQCEALTSLHASNNKLTVLPAALSRLSCLQSLQLHSNQLSHIPLGVCALFALEELTLGHNQLTVRTPPSTSKPAPFPSVGSAGENPYVPQRVVTMAGGAALHTGCAHGDLSAEAPHVAEPAVQPALGAAAQHGQYAACAHGAATQRQPAEHSAQGARAAAPAEAYDRMQPSHCPAAAGESKPFLSV
jgi:hypothetical protein